MHGYTVLAADGDIGEAHDFNFHDDTWFIRYLPVDTDHWLPGRKVLVPPRALRKPNRAGFTFPVALTREQVEKSPDIDTDKPVSRQHELDLHNNFSWPFYWIEPGPGGCQARESEQRTSANAPLGEWSNQDSVHR